MPLLHKPRDPNYGVKRDRRRSDRRKKLYASPLVETVVFIDAQQAPRSKTIDEVIKLYAARRKELSERTWTNGRRQAIGIKVTQETYAFVELMLRTMTPGELIDEAIRLYRQLHEK